MSDLVRGKKRKKKKKKKKGKAQELGKLFLLALSHKELQERPTTKPRFGYTGPSSAQPNCGTKPLSVQCLLDLLAASLTFSVLSSRCELLTRS